MSSEVLEVGRDVAALSGQRDRQEVGRTRCGPHDADPVAVASGPDLPPLAIGLAVPAALPPSRWGCRYCPR